MSRYRVEIARRAIKALAGLPRQEQQRVRAAIDLLADNPRPPGCTKLIGEDDTYRVRVGVYRILYDVLDDRLLVHVVRVSRRAVAPRSSLMTAFSHWCGRRSRPDPSGGTKDMSTTCTWASLLLWQGPGGRLTIGPGSRRCERQTVRLADVADPDEEQRRRLKLLCEALNEHGVAYVVFGSFAGRLQGAPLRTLDVDVVPEASDDNLQRLCDALNLLAPRWRIDDVSTGLKIDGDSLEPRHIRGSSIAIRLVTRAGMVDIVMEPAGFSYRDLVGSAVTVDVAFVAPNHLTQLPERPGRGHAFLIRHPIG